MLSYLLTINASCDLLWTKLISVTRCIDGHYTKESHDVLMYDNYQLPTTDF
jgi:hypothetical protein